MTENVGSRLHPVSHFFFRKNINHSFHLLLQLIDTRFLFIQHTFSLHYFKLLPILNVKIILFQQFLHTSLKKSARVCLQNNSAMHFQDLGDRSSLLSLLMIFLLIFFQSLELKYIEKFLTNFGELKGKLLPIIKRYIATLNFTSNYWKNLSPSLKSTSKGFSCIST